ncbi:helix-turn-helix transcriptional regulator [Paraburkholderia phenoliruptrix]|uniref:helix-turn-helix transcriptional regulator n=1 Tax=Paraburkholderia phenoliruptrix TaxID=252970 RepID=UPI0001C02FCB|nr:hypothetical protein [Paraburkholderia phenoliruptrix]MDR6392271.1 putative DNA-binding transcriptional regulator AlpA [Paraburkholderia phenoliruptrix]
MTDPDPLRVISIGDLRRALDVSAGVIARMGKRNELPMPITLTPRGTRLWLASDVRSWLAGKPVDRTPPTPAMPGHASRVAEAAGYEDDDARDEQRYAPRRSCRSADDVEAERREPGELQRVLRAWAAERAMGATNNILETEQI